MPKDYYDILGIEKGASKDEIKKAFRKKAHQYHPDKETGDEAKFKEINEAYQVLSDEKKRAQYDQFGQTFDGAGGFPGGGFGGFGAGGINIDDLGDIFGDFFGGGFGGSRAQTQRGQDIQVDISLTFKESIFGAEKEIPLTKNNTCDRCGGVGAEPGSSMKTCGTCSGQGFEVRVQRTMLGNMQTRVTCSTCHGTGEVPETPCTNCDGSGVVHGKKTLRVDIPAGVEDGMRIRVREEGEAVQGGQAGDLYLIVHVERSREFERHGSDLFVEAKIGFTQAALGDEIEVPTLDGKAKLKIPAGIQSGEKLRMRGKGVRGSRPGDQYVVVTVVTPKKLNKKQRKVLEELDLKG